ncbi:MAG: hypothetical protein IJ072_00530 [Oscillospiraceae bacterium]|nr:hypothetical protein [Oscillospiraceae bacterium]
MAGIKYDETWLGNITGIKYANEVRFFVYKGTKRTMEKQRKRDMRIQRKYGKKNG